MQTSTGIADMARCKQAFQIKRAYRRPARIYQLVTFSHTLRRHARMAAISSAEAAACARAIAMSRFPRRDKPPFCWPMMPAFRRFIYIHMSFLDFFEPSRSHASRRRSADIHDFTTTPGAPAAAPMPGHDAPAAGHLTRRCHAFAAAAQSTCAPRVIRRREAPSATHKKQGRRH